jgi:hypothetical protein
MTDIHLGDTVYDAHTSLEGVVDRVCTYQHATTQYGILRKGVDNNGAPWDVIWLELERICKADDQ